MISNLRLKIKSKYGDSNDYSRRLKTQNVYAKPPKDPLAEDLAKIKASVNSKKPLHTTNNLPAKKQPAVQTHKAIKLIPKKETKPVYHQIRTQENYKESFSFQKKMLINKILGARQRTSIHTTQMNPIIAKKPTGQQRYVIQKKAGSGTFGVVHRATDRQTLEKVAIKKVFQDKKYKNRELEILKMLNHPNLVKIRDSFYSYEEDKEYLNVVMDYFPLNLGEYIVNHKGQGQIPLIKQKLYGYQLFKGLLYLQEIKVAHRDIKPHNILVNDQKGRLIICDFGSAKCINPKEQNLAYICSRSYRAPQLIFGSTYYKGHIDVWSSGCILAEMVTQNPVFRGNSNIDQLVQIIKILGAPSEQEILEMNPDCDIQTFKIPQVQGLTWIKFLKKKQITAQFIDLLEKVMCYSPKKRLTPFEVLKHPFFNQIRNPDNFKKLMKQYQISDLFDFSHHKGLTDKQIKQLTPTWYLS